MTLSDNCSLLSSFVIKLKLCIHFFILKNSFSNQNSKYNVLKNKILEKAKKIADIFEEYKVFEINEDKNKYINNFKFNDYYMELIYKWIKSDKDKKNLID